MPTLPNARALIVGIADYQHIRALPDSVRNDARAIRDLLVNPNFCAYPPENVTQLLDGQATRAALLDALDNLAERTDKDAIVFIYMSMHGGRIADGDDAGEYLLPVDTQARSDTEPDPDTAIISDEFSAALQRIPARKVTVVLDCCHAGGVGDAKGGLVTPAFKKGLSDAAYDRLAAGKGRAILASSRDEEESIVLAGAENSLFTQHLLAGLQGNAASDDEMIRIFDLFEYVQPKVTADFADQHPVFKSNLETNFPVALYQGGKKGVIPRVDDGFRYDAYISYVDEGADANWVWDTLVPKLEDEGLKIAISGDVENPGVARVVGVERGIEQAKRTIIVLSPAYLADHMADFENTVAQTMGIQEGAYRLLPVMIEPIEAVQLPTRLSMLTTLNLVHPRRAARELTRLIQALQGPLPRR